MLYSLQNEFMSPGMRQIKHTEHCISLLERKSWVVIDDLFRLWQELLPHQNAGKLDRDHGHQIENVTSIE